MSVELKEDCSIMDPVLRVHHADNYNPETLNYCYISKFGRSYFIQDWKYVIGEWEATLTCDVLASFKGYIQALSKYVLRSAKKENKNIVDDFYPSLAWQPNYYYDTDSFGFTTDMAGGTYILGIANNSVYGMGAICYYALSYDIFRDFAYDLLPPASQSWSAAFTGLTDALYRAIYDPFSYIKSCKWFPFTIPSTSTGGISERVKFGNFEASATVLGDPIVRDSSLWYTNSATVNLPSGWLSLTGKERSEPYAHLYLVCNPWGIIPLNPQDFTDSSTIKLYIQPDLISGNCFLRIFKVVGSTEYFITMRTAQIAVDIPLTATGVDAKGMLMGAGVGAGGLGAAVAGLAVGSPAAFGKGLIAAAGGVASAAISGVPSISNSIGQAFNSVTALDGEITLIYQNTYFADEAPDEFGHPLYSTETLSDLAAGTGNSGYIKCADGEHNVPCFLNEKQQISTYLTEGFYLE